MKPISDQHIIDKYLRNEELSVEEDQFFQSRMQDDGFVKLLTEMQMIYQVAKANDRKEMKEKLMQVEDGMRGNGRWKKMVIVIVAILILAGVYYISRTIESNQQKIFASYYEPYPNVIDPLTKSTIEDGNVYHLYERERYDEVIASLGTKKDITDDELFYLAQAYLAKGNYVQAVQVLESIPTDKYREEVKWYMALMCLQIERQGCKEKFQSIKGPYFNKAQEVYNLLLSMDN